MPRPYSEIWISTLQAFRRRFARPALHTLRPAGPKTSPSCTLSAEVNWPIGRALVVVLSMHFGVSYSWLTADINGAQRFPAEAKVCEACPCTLWTLNRCYPRPFHRLVMTHFDSKLQAARHFLGCVNLLQPKRHNSSKASPLARVPRLST